MQRGKDMSEEIKVGQIEGDDDFDKFTEWVAPNTTEAYKLGYPLMRILKASNGRPVQFAMVHPVAVIEHLASNPECGKLELVRALKALVDAVKVECLEQGVGEIWCLTGYGDEAIEDLARHYGFEMVPLTLWRLKV